MARIFTVKDVQEQFSVSSMTARKDLSDLVKQGYMTEIALNKVTRGYIKVQEGGLKGVRWMLVSPNTILKLVLEKSTLIGYKYSSELKKIKP